MVSQMVYIQNVDQRKPGKTGKIACLASRAKLKSYFDLLLYGFIQSFRYIDLLLYGSIKSFRYIDLLLYGSTDLLIYCSSD